MFESGAAVEQQKLRKLSLVSGIAVTSVANIAIGGLGFLSGPLLARALGPSGRGELAALQNLYWFVGTIGMMGMAEATLFFSSRFKENTRQIVSNGILVSIFITPVFCLLAWCFVDRLFASQHVEIATYARKYIFAAPLLCLSVIPVFALRGQQDFLLWNLVRFASPLGWLLAILIRGRHGVSSINLAGDYLWVLVASGALALSTIFLKTSTHHGALTSNFIPRMLRYGSPLAIATIPITLNLKLDQLSMAALISPEQLGYYAVAVSWGAICTPVLVAIGTVLFPKIAEIQDSEELQKAIASGSRLAISLAVLVTILVTLITPSLLPRLFGEAFRPALMAAMVSVLAAAISGYNIVLEECLRGIGNTKAVLRAEVAGFIVIFCTVFVAIIKGGIVGAALSSVVGYLFTTAFLLRSISAAIKIPIRQLFPMVGRA